MRTRPIKLVLAVAAIVCAVAATGITPEAPAKGRPTCAPAGSRTLAATGFARVYVRKGRDYACVLRQGHAIPLGDDVSSCDDPPCDVVGRVALGGRFLAVEYRTVARSFSTTLLTRTDLRSGAHDNVWLGGDEGDGDTSVEDLFVTKSGAMAWLALSQAGSSFDVEVHAWRRSDRVVAAGPHIQLGSLAIASSHLYWLDGGEPRTALLP